MGWGPWQESGPWIAEIDVDAGVTAVMQSTPYAAGIALGEAAGSASVTWTMYNSLASQAALTNVWNDAGARACALRHVKAGEAGAQLGWDPGECAAITAGHPFGGGTGLTWTAGTVSSWDPGFGISIAGHYSLQGYFGRAGITFSGPEPAAADLPYESVPMLVAYQVPGLFDHIRSSGFTGVWPQIIGLRTTAEAHLQATGGSGDTIGEVRTGVAVPGGLPNYGEVGGQVASVSPGGETVIDLGVVEPGSAWFWDITSSLVTANTDPGPSASHYLQGTCRVRSSWWLKARFWDPDLPDDVVVPPLRQLQRDDGLGRSPYRARGRASRQGSQRQRAYL